MAWNSIKYSSDNLVDAETNKKGIFISFWQLLEKCNLLLFCSCSKVMFHYVQFTKEPLT